MPLALPLTITQRNYADCQCMKAETVTASKLRTEVKWQKEQLHQIYPRKYVFVEAWAKGWKTRQGLSSQSRESCLAWWRHPPTEGRHSLTPREALFSPSHRRFLQAQVLGPRFWRSGFSEQWRAPLRQPPARLSFTRWGWGMAGHYQPWQKAGSMATLLKACFS